MNRECIGARGDGSPVARLKVARPKKDRKP
jgi:hypothetical protein